MELIAGNRRLIVKESKESEVKKIFYMLTAPICLLAPAACSILGFQPENEIIEVADIVDEYLAIKVASDLEGTDDDLYEDENRSTSSSLSSTLTSNTTRELDDNGTPGDPTDDTITVTRIRTEWNGLTTRHVVTRPPRPTVANAWDSVWDLDLRYRQEGSIAVYLGDFTAPHRSGTTSALWEKRSEVVLVELTNSVEHLDGSGAVIEAVVTIDPETGRRSRTETRYRVVGQDTVVVSVSTSEETIDANTGESVHRVVSDRREGYALVRHRDDSRIIEFYDNNDVLEVVVTQTRNETTGRLEVRRDFYLEGEIVRSVEGSVRYLLEDGVLTIVRERADGVSRTVTVTESERGFTIVRDGVTYTVVVENGTMTIEFDRGIFTVQRATNGEWIVV